MHTTIALQPGTHELLLDLKRKQRLPSMDAVVRSLLETPVLSATALFRKNEAAVRAVCRRYGIKRLVAFGSRARGDARPDSDLDLAGRLPAGASLFDVAHLTEDLENILGVPVQFVSEWPGMGPIRKSIARDGVVLVG